MSSLIFYTDPSQALVVTDTLVADRAGVPLAFCSKAFHLPHLRMVIAGTGIRGFSDYLVFKANNGLFRGIENLDHHAPSELRAQWADHYKPLIPENDITTTVYAFGLSEVDGTIAAFAYRSTNDFASERLNHGTGVKPECAVPDGNLIDHIEGMMREQRSLQAAEPLSSRIHIGGDAIAMHLTGDGCHTWPLFQFEDHAQQLRTMHDNHRANLTTD